VPWTTLISAQELASAIDHCVVVDCRHELLNPATGPQAYAQGHLPGARFMHQDHDLAGPKNGRNGRHPLPDRAAMAERLRAAGLHRDQQLVAYDDHGGMYAVRLWWLARWLGHENVAVLDGGIKAWTGAGFPLDTAVPLPRPGDFAESASLVRAVDTREIVDQLGTDRLIIVDMRAPERYRGEAEPIDPVAGHVPGALNRPFQQNLRPDGRFKPAEVLRQEYEALLGGRPPSDVAFHCGSGVVACHGVIAMELAGLTGSALYPGSWSEWCADPGRPVATGPEP
jgi:thiosulfate/3-mercaptopyruvate sulfurtransferase